MVVIYADGLCEAAYPGGIATYGYILRFSDGRPAVFGKGLVARGSKQATNNVAEYMAVYEALLALVAISYRGPVEVRSDSQLLIRQMQGLYRVKSQRLAQYYLAVTRVVMHFEAVQWTWIPREKNQEADALSWEAYQEALTG